MGDTAAIVNLMRHAADRLAREDVSRLVPVSTQAFRAECATSVAVAMTYAEAILRTVAAALDETNDQPPCPAGSSCYALDETEPPP